MHDSSHSLPLKGIRVLDLSSIIAGPMATLIFASLGADVIKVERIDGGDDSRHMGPHMGEWSSVFLPMNRGKRSIAIDLSKPAGRDVILRLAKKCDVFIENFRGGKLAALGLDESAVRAQNPSIIYASISAFGNIGPDASRPGYEALVQGRSGIMSVTGPHPGSTPVRAGVPIIDGSAGMWIAIGVLAALFERRKSGIAQKVDTSLLESGVMLMFHNLLGQQFSGADPVPQGSRYPSFGAEGGSFSPYGAFETADGWILIGVSSDRIFRRLGKALGHSEWADDARFLTNVLRVEHREELNREMQALLRKHPTLEWKALFDAHDVPISPIQSCGQVLRDPQVEAMRQLDDMVLPGRNGKTVAVPHVPLHLSVTPLRPLGLAPTLSQHGREILVEYGFGPEEIERLCQEGIVKLLPTNSDGDQNVGATSQAESR
jgi:crotonobetainyl-CoA:carnitine CoA-transferase CaiB-like acyl-CoA transferase